MAVRAEQGLPRHAEAFDVHLVTDTVARLGKADAVFFGNTLDIHMIVRVLKTGLQRVVVDVGDRQLGFHPLQADRLELQVGHRSGRILRQRLVDADGDFLSGFHAAGQQVICDDFLGQGHSHVVVLPFDVFPGKAAPSWVRAFCSHNPAAYPVARSRVLWTRPVCSHAIRQETKIILTQNRPFAQPTRVRPSG